MKRAFEIIIDGLKRIGLACLVSFVPMLFAIIYLSSVFNWNIELTMNVIIGMVVVGGALTLFIKVLINGMD